MNWRRLLMRLFLGRRLPTVDGELPVPGLAAPVTLRRDRHGIACIEAASLLDAMYAVGFAQGQDRAFQLETLQRIVRGTLAEMVGEPGLPADRLSRRIGFRRAAIAQVAVLDADVRTALEAFCEGINAGRTVGSPKPAHEFAILKCAPTPWEAADVLGLLKLMSFSLPGNWDVELARMRMLQSDGESAMQSLDPAICDALLSDLRTFQSFAPPGGGSNNWLVAGSRTASGKPLLASDPHLGPHVPPPWYLCQIRTPELTLAGATLAGAPVVIIGHNGFAAWGVTAGLTDNTDLFLEMLEPDGRSVRNADGSFAPCEVLQEKIAVKGGAEVVEEIVVTPRGPIVTPLFEGITEAISLRAVWLDPLPLRGFFDAPKYRSFDAFRHFFEKWPSLPLNVLYADESGETGYQLAGQLPVRSPGFGTMPGLSDWIGLVPFHQMPTLANPPKGYLATANSDPNDFAPTSAFLGIDFIDDYRRRRIEEMLGKRDNLWDAADLGKIQLDTYSLPWREMKVMVLAVTSNEPDALAALQLLKDWNGYVDPDSAGAAVFELFCAEMAVRCAKAKAPKSWMHALGGDAGSPLTHNLFSDRRIGHLSKLLNTHFEGWFAHGWPAEIADVLAAVIRRLRTEFGPSPAWWPWGNLHTLHLTHTLFGKHRLLGPVFNIEPFAVGGDSNTISQAGVLPLAPTKPTHNMANLRCVFDTGNWSNSRVVLCGGQSGNPLSPHYRDQLSIWQSGEAVPLPFTPAEVLKAAKHTLRLMPA